MLADLGIFIVAMTALVWGANFVIKEAERIALHFNISHFVIGATLVALGTSLPEMAASIEASWLGHSDLAVSNVMGSNILNICMVLGLVFLFAKKIAPARDLFKEDSAWALAPVLIFALLVLDGVITRMEGLLFLGMMGAYLYFLAVGSEALSNEVDEKLEKAPFRWPRTLALLAAGFVLVIVGADFTVMSAASIARDLGVGEWIIGLLLVAFGTSLPELAVSLSAARKNNADMSIGNIIGSNMANLSVVLGGAALVRPLPVDFSVSLFDMAAMGAATLLLVFITANRLYNKSGGLLLLGLLLLVLNNALSQVA